MNNAPQRRGNRWMSKPLPNGNHSYLIGYLNNWIPEWIDSPEMLAVFYSEVLNFRAQKRALEQATAAMREDLSLSAGFEFGEPFGTGMV